MTGYWLNCNQCDNDFRFDEVTDKPAIPSYLWYTYFESDCDQSLLRFKCPKCKKGTVQIAYHLNPKDGTIMKVNHIVFRRHSEDEDFYQMLWETHYKSQPKSQIYDFKYMYKNRAIGLNRPVIMEKNDLVELLRLFNKKCHNTFPIDPNSLERM